MEEKAVKGWFIKIARTILILQRWSIVISTFSNLATVQNWQRAYSA